MVSGPGPDVRERPGWSARSLATLSLVAAAAGALALRHLGTKPLWRDEAASLTAAKRSLVDLIALLPRRDANSGVYYLLLHLWLPLRDRLPLPTTGEETWSRALSVVFAVAAVAAAGWCAAR